MKDLLMDFASRLVLGTETPERGGEVAAEVLAEGFDSEALRALAAQEDPRSEEVMPILNRALADLGRNLPTPTNAALWLAARTALKMLAKEINAYDGSKAIWALARRVPGDAVAKLDPFIYAASEWEDRPEDRPWLEKAMLESAEDLVRAELEGGASV